MYRKIKNIYLAALISAPLFALAAPQSTASVTPAKVKSTEAQHFPTPDDAAKTLLEAARSDDRKQIIALFGSHDADLLSSGDEVEDKNNRSDFVTLAQEKMSVEKIGEDRAIVHVGNTDWPFPIPLVKNGDSWQFDAEQGRQEILNRRIGRNELSALGAIRGYVEAQFDYANSDRDDDGVSEYAQKSDQLETFFINLIRHSGLKGLAGIPPVRGKILRPLLLFTKEEMLLTPGLITWDTWTIQPMKQIVTFVTVLGITSFQHSPKLIHER